MALASLQFNLTALLVSTFLQAGIALGLHLTKMVVNLS